MKKAILIQANGNNLRLSKYFSQPKYELYFKGNRIIDTIKNNSISICKNVYIALKKDSHINFNTSDATLILCDETTSRLDTLKQCIPKLLEYDSLIIHDCDVIINSDILHNLYNNCIAVTNYKFDGMKYGFVELDSNFKYITSNEKIKETPYISIGAYCVNVKEFNDYLLNATEESLLHYYNNCSQPNVIYSKNHINLGDINSYMENLWLS